ncbi:methyltransferase domain-containing protein [Paenibacillus sp. NEAU-GSW1]|uniref:methyltransferase domain-containing protein n=1 Tax=Paenibacillus sp. NEAU-GSW1 TaxID=2682486 RepID=UPI0012E26E32|nr:methyltransferase domain-containing protein [Paenibacillus sp. NEAU-GSW1]MUT68830.1 methyltransferase domain-containing protein [Paenibacillus sp. NEAU-GSW1]
MKVYYEQIGVAMTCRGYDEYIQMFDLQESELFHEKVLDVAGGGSSFTAEARRRGIEAFAVDPRYAQDVEQWIKEAAEEIAVSTAKLDKLKELFDWSYYGSLDNHRAGREASLQLFASHLATEEGQRAYCAGALPELPFEDDSFSLVTCSHFLFLYAEQFGFEFHKQAVLELMRVCKPGGEVRIYPLLTLKWNHFEQMDQLLAAIEEAGGKPTRQPSKLPFMPGSNEFLRIEV